MVEWDSQGAARFRALRSGQQLSGQHPCFGGHIQSIQIGKTGPTGITDIGAGLQVAADGPGRIVDDDIVITYPALPIAYYIVDDSHHLTHFYLQTGLLPGLAANRLLEWLPQFDSPTREGPETFGRLLVPPDEDNAVPFKDHSTHGHNGGFRVFASHIRLHFGLHHDSSSFYHRAREQSTLMSASRENPVEKLPEEYDIMDLYYTAQTGEEEGKNEDPIF